MGNLLSISECLRSLWPIKGVAPSEKWEGEKRDRKGSGGGNNNRAKVIQCTGNRHCIVVVVGREERERREAKIPGPKLCWAVLLDPMLWLSSPSSGSFGPRFARFVRPSFVVDRSVPPRVRNYENCWIAADNEGKREGRVNSGGRGRGGGGGGGWR